MTRSDPTTTWVRATLDVAVLAVLVEGDLHGYALAQRLGELGFGQVRGGVLYPVLGRLEGEGAVRSSWRPGEGGPGRKVYALTDAGRTRLVDDRARWQDFVVTVDRLFATTGEEG